MSSKYQYFYKFRFLVYLFGVLIVGIGIYFMGSIVFEPQPGKKVPVQIRKYQVLILENHKQALFHFLKRYETMHLDDGIVSHYQGAREILENIDPKNDVFFLSTAKICEAGALLFTGAAYLPSIYYASMNRKMEVTDMFLKLSNDLNSARKRLRTTNMEDCSEECKEITNDLMKKFLYAMFLYNKVTLWGWDETGLNTMEEKIKIIDKAIGINLKPGTRYFEVSFFLEKTWFNAIFSLFAGYAKIGNESLKEKVLAKYPEMLKMAHEMDSLYVEEKEGNNAVQNTEYYFRELVKASEMVVEMAQESMEMLDEVKKQQSMSD